MFCFGVLVFVVMVVFVQVDDIVFVYILVFDVLLFGFEVVV